MKRKLGKNQQGVLAAIRHHGFWHRGPGCGWKWDGERGTERILDSLRRVGLVDLIQERRIIRDQTRIIFVYRPVPEPRVMSAGNTIILSDCTKVDGGNMLAMLNAQYKVLMKLSRRLTKVSGEDSPEQNMIADANVLGLEVADRLKEL